MLDGASPSTQCFAVMSQFGRISAAPQKWPPLRFCSEAGKGYASVALTPPTIVVLGPSGSATAGGPSDKPVSTATAASSVLRITPPSEKGCMVPNAQKSGGTMREISERAGIARILDFAPISG